MEYFFVLLGLLLFKHGVLAHVVDFGYSDCRNPRIKRMHENLAKHCITEAAATILLLKVSGASCCVVPLVLALELLAQIASSLVERRAPIRRVIEYHVTAEVAVLMVYAMAAFFAVVLSP